MQISARNQLLDQQSGHDGLAGSGVVGEQKAQRLAREHFTVDGNDLVGERVNDRRMDSKNGVEQVREVDAVGFRHKAKQRSVTIEAPWAANGNDF